MCLLPFLYSGSFHSAPGGYLCETGILLLALSRYIGDPDVIDHLIIVALSEVGFVLTRH
jgi:hypothetical protein